MRFWRGWGRGIKEWGFGGGGVAGLRSWVREGCGVLGNWLTSKTFGQE